MLEPNLFIAGAPKAGTTFLYHVLKDHEDLYFPRVKELNHYSNEALDKLGSYYKDYRVKDHQKYLSHFAEGQNHKYRVDASVSYFTFSDVPTSIKEQCPDARILFILRNPIQRAFSHYNMDVRMGYAKETFTEYIQNQSKHPVHFHQYVKNGFYYKNIKNFIDAFGSNVHIVILEDIKSEIDGIFDFLQIKQINIDTDKRFNQNKKPRNFIARILQRNRKLTSRLKMLIPSKISSKLNRHLYKDDNKKVISDLDKNHLKAIYKEDIQKLGKLLKKDLNKLWLTN